MSPSSSMRPRFLIIGQGLAGTSLAWQLFGRGVPFVLVDKDEEQTSSKVAAGLVTPVTGMRLNLNWRYDTLYPEAVAFYRQIESVLGAVFYHELPIVRLLRDERAAGLWDKRRLQPEILPYLADARQPLVNGEVFANPHGGFEQCQSGWMDTAAFLCASRAYFESIHSWRCGEVAEESLDTSGEGLVWQGETFSQAVFCTGWEAARHPWFQWVPFQSAQGTVLSLEADTGGERRIINRGCWLLPRADGSFRAGPTYDLKFTDPQTASREMVDGLQAKLKALLKVPYRVTGSQTGVRPIIKGHQALFGRHPARPQIAMLNGLGSKGVLRAPWVSRQLASHLLEGCSIEPGLDLARNL